MSDDVVTIAPAFAEIAGQLPPLSTPEDLGRVLHIPVNTLNDWRSRGRNLRFVKIGRMVYYRREDVLAYLQSQVFSSTAEARTAARTRRTADALAGDTTGPES
ncbi:helix-turn-helix domain-containing protein [Bifidobacterium simiarum]|uniref:helix-turn-helix domain-containing protein n=1 Tax=Bifidobacterium simiarum TaxID=2045441 RepID=UPI001BDD21A3|nr:helix-turn-helix domain-containing protein [Bifidobacterium simiarum]MBT1167007.1 helix-turn-helix domain-containing protein [Bifidobacterium simiarum]